MARQLRIAGMLPEQEHLSRGVYRKNYEGIREIARTIWLVVDQHLV